MAPFRFALAPRWCHNGPVSARIRSESVRFGPVSIRVGSAFVRGGTALVRVGSTSVRGGPASVRAVSASVRSRFVLASRWRRVGPHWLRVGSRLSRAGVALAPLRLALVPRRFALAPRRFAVAPCRFTSAPRRFALDPFRPRWNEYGAASVPNGARQWSRIGGKKKYFFLGHVVDGYHAPSLGHHPCHQHRARNVHATVTKRHPQSDQIDPQKKYFFLVPFSTKS